MLGGRTNELITAIAMLSRTQTSLSLSLDENVRAKEGGKETTGETSLRLPSVPIPWSLAVHHQLLGSTPEEKADTDRYLTGLSDF